MRSLVIGLALLALAACKPEPAVVVTHSPVRQSGLAAAERARWNSIRVTNPMRADKLVERYKHSQSTYLSIQRMRKNGVPAQVVFGLHYRESDNDMHTNPAQGDPLNHKSIHVPKGRIPGKNPPYTFLQAAEDAYYSPELDHLDTRDWSEIGAILESCESFNGLGYYRRGVVSPYVWAGTSAYSRGKFVADGRFDPYYTDKQLGVAAILKRFIERGIK